MEESKCNLEVIKKDGTVECRAICPIHFMTDMCCAWCDEIVKCKRVCGYMRKKRDKFNEV